MKRTTSLALVLAVLAAIGTSAANDRATAAERRQGPDDAAQITRYRAETIRWQQVMGRTVAATRLEHRLPAVQAWRNRALRAQRLASHPPHRRQWLCIHRYEAPWHARTGNGYYGGLQMDVEFQRFYAAGLLRHKGTADRWTPLEQMWVAERAERNSGFWPWPNTARMCGLL